MHAVVDASPAGITRARRLRRSIPAHRVRRVHVFTDANGEQGIVVRRCWWCFVHISRDELAEPAVRAGVVSLLDEVRPHARVDAHVDEFLAAA